MVHVEQNVEANTRHVPTGDNTETAMTTNADSQGRINVDVRHAKPGTQILVEGIGMLIAVVA